MQPLCPAIIKVQGFRLARKKGIQRFWLHCHDCCCALTQMYIYCAETHLMNAIVFP